MLAARRGFVASRSENPLAPLLLSRRSTFVTSKLRLARVSSRYGNVAMTFPSGRSRAVARKLEWVLQRPWIAHAVSFVVMVGIACPRYRRPGGTTIGLWEYGVDSLLLALQLPAFLPHMFVGRLVPGLVTIGVVWALALAPLPFSRRPRALKLSYVTLGFLWLSYSFGWVFTQSWTPH